MKIGLLALMAWVCVTVARAEEAAPRTIGEVTVQGNRFIKRKTVLSKVKARKGDVVVNTTFRSDLDRLLETNLYENVEVILEDMPQARDARGQSLVRLIFVVKERPIIRRVDFKGNRRLSDSTFREDLTSKADEPFDRIHAAQDVDKILAKYREEGYADAQAEYYTSIDPRTNKVLLTFFITEGQRVLVRRVEVQGNQFISERKARKILKKTRRKKVFKEENLREDLDKLTEFYKNRGFLEAQVAVSTRTFNEEHTQLSLGISVSEGRRYTVGQFSFAGETLYSEKDLRKAVTLRSAKLYQQDRMDESVRNIQELYADKGYLRAEITPTPHTEPTGEMTGRVDIHFDIVESSVVFVDRIYVDGNTYTKEKVIRREILLKEGDVFSASKLRRSVERIYNLGFIDEVQPDVQQPRSPSLADVVFGVQEGKPGVLSAGAGFSSVDGLLGTLQLQHSNVFGLGQRVNVMWEFGKKKQNFEISWTEPWFMDKPVALTIDVFNTRRRFFATGNTPDYKRDSRGFGMTFRPRLTDRLSTVHGYTYSRNETFDVDPTSVPDPDPRVKNELELKSSITNGVTWDMRDNVFDPTRGWMTRGTVETAGGVLGGNTNFYKPILESSIHFPTFWKFVMGFSARGSYVQRYGSSPDVPLSERFRIGGPDTVRGYELGRVGVDNGSVMTVFNAEYKFPIVQERSRTILQGAFFADAGGSWNRLREFRWDIGSHVPQMRSSIGFGIRFKTPVFPIRLDWAVPMNRRTGEPIQPFNFTIGSIF